MEENVSDFLKKKDNNRVLMLGSKNGLFECLSQHIFQVNIKEFQSIFKSFMQRDEEKFLFKNILQLLDNSGKVPLKKDGESDEAFKTRLDECYDGITNTCNDIQPYSNCLHVYVFAIATLIGRPIFILHQDEAGDLSWSYFPCLYSRACDLVRDEPKYTAQRYITMFFSTDHCYKIDSSRCSELEPQSHGCIGVYSKRLKAILIDEGITQKYVSEMARRIQRPEVQLKLQGSLSVDIMTQSIEMYNSRSPGNVYSRTHGATLPAKLLNHRPKRYDFVTQLLNDTHLLKCLFKVSVENKDGPLVWRSVASSGDGMFVWCSSFKCVQVIESYAELWFLPHQKQEEPILSRGFLPLEFHEKLFQLEESVIELQVNTSEFLERCTAVTQELSERRGRVNKAVIGGSAAGIVGGGMAIAGLILTPFTFGASLALTIAGASLGVAGGVVGGTARVVEGVKQNIRIREISEVQREIAKQENNFVECIRDIELIIAKNSSRNLDHVVEGPGMNRRGFLAVGSAFRSLHGSVAIALAAIRVGAVGATIAASVLGPLSLVFDIGFLAEAAHNLRKGCKTGAGQILKKNGWAIDMKMNFFICMLRGNTSIYSWIIDM